MDVISAWQRRLLMCRSVPNSSLSNYAIAGRGPTIMISMLSCVCSKGCLAKCGPVKPVDVLQHLLVNLLWV